jgi:NADH dehydrogenase
MRVLVLGGSGFIGRQAAAALLERGHEVAIGTRFPERLERRLPQALRGCERREVHFERLLERDGWLVLLAGYDAVVNAVGILRERRGESYDRVHHLAPAALGAACALAGRRLVHVSALGLHATARSAFIRSKIAGEHGVASSGSDYCIVRPSLLDGPGGFGARWLRAMARLPVHFVPADARGKIAAMHVRDLGAAIALLCENERSRGVREAELGGVHLLTMAEYLAALRRRVSARPALVIPVPAWLARFASHACDLLHFSPFSFGHLELMRRDNAPRVNLLPWLLQRPLAVVVNGCPKVVEPPAIALGRPAL